MFGSNGIIAGIALNFGFVNTISILWLCRTLPILLLPTAETEDALSISVVISVEKGNTPTVSGDKEWQTVPVVIKDTHVCCAGSGAGSPKAETRLAKS